MKKILLACNLCGMLMACHPDRSIAPKAAISISAFVPTASAPGITAIIDPSNADQYFMVIPFNVTAKEQDVYLPAHGTLIAVGSKEHPVLHAAADIQCIIDNGSNLVEGMQQIYFFYYSHNGNVVADANGNYKIPAGQTLPFAINILFNPSTPGQYRARVVNINFNTNDSRQYLSCSAGLDSLVTPYVSTP